MKIYSLLEEEHRQMEKLINKIEEMQDEEMNVVRKNHLHNDFEKLKNKILSHSKPEEDVFYKYLQTKDKQEDLKKLILESKEEHHLVERTLEELSPRTIFDDKWFSKLHELKEILLHHIAQEERKLFPAAQKILAAEDEKQIKELFMKEKEEYKHLASQP